MQGRLELASVTFYVRYIGCIVMVVSNPSVSFLSLRLVPGRVVLPLGHLRVSVVRAPTVYCAL